MTINLKKYKVWFITGSQKLYGPEPLEQVKKHSQEIVKGLNESSQIPCQVEFKPVVKTPEEIYNVCTEANTTPDCVGLIMWMHTFSPAKMWIASLNALQKPFLHLHTQFNRDIPWKSIDMDFMNLNQSAHGGREFGHICTRMRKNRKVVAGHWQDNDVIEQLDIWMRAACAWADTQNAKICRFGDNMREVAVTEGDKVEAQMKLGYSVSGYGVGDLVEYVNNVTDTQIDKLIEEYKDVYQFDVSDQYIDSVREAARIEAGMKNFLDEGKFTSFTTTFEDLHGLKQLPGLAVQRLMAQGYGFGAEGDWKTAALIRAMKVMSAGKKGGTSFMEDYTYHLEPGRMRVLGAHMLEVCTSIAKSKPSLEVHPLGIGGKADPVRVVFNVPSGPAVNASLVDMGDRFRMIANKLEVVEPDDDLPNLPVARAVWIPKPNVKVAAGAWILAGGAHHASFSMAVDSRHLEDFADIAGLEYLQIDENTTMSGFKKECIWNDLLHSKK